MQSTKSWKSILASAHTIFALHLWICKKHPNRFYRTWNKLIFQQKYKVAFLPVHIGHSRVLKLPLVIDWSLKTTQSCHTDVMHFREEVRDKERSDEMLHQSQADDSNTQQCPKHHDMARQAAQRQKNVMTPTQAAQVPRGPHCSYMDATSGLRVGLSLQFHCRKLAKEPRHTSKQSPWIYRKNLSRKQGPWNCFRAILFML